MEVMKVRGVIFYYEALVAPYVFAKKSNESDVDHH